MDNSRFIDLNIDGIHVKYLSPDGSSITAEIYERLKKELKEKKNLMLYACPHCQSNAINSISSGVFQCNACSYEDLDIYFFQ